MNFRSPFKINSCYNSYYSVFNCSNLVITCSIPNVCGDTSQQILSIIITDTAVLKTKNIQTINTSSDNLITTLINPSPLKDRTRFVLHDGSSHPDSIKSIFLPFASTINVISFLSKIWLPNPKNNYKPTLCTDVNEYLYVYKDYGKSMTISPS